MEQATSIGEIALALSALLVLIYPLAQPAFLMAVMLAVVPAQAGAEIAVPQFSAPAQSSAESSAPHKNPDNAATPHSHKH